jgi:hypothetical protein
MLIAGKSCSSDLPTEMSVSTSGFNVVSRDTTTTIVDKNSRGKDGSRGYKVTRSVNQISIFISRAVHTYLLLSIQPASRDLRFESRIIDLITSI